MQRFLPYLPDRDVSTVSDPLASEALDVIQEDVEWLLLSCDCAEFWGVIRSDSSLVALVDSYTRYARRPFDEGFSDCTAVELNIWRLILAVLHRAACRQEAGSPPPAERAALLSRLLDIPRLLDLCALYSTCQGGQLQDILQAMFRLQPSLAGELAAVAGTVAGNLSQVLDACLEAAAQAAGDPDMMQSVMDGVEYLRDVCLTLCALLGAYPPAASIILSKSQALLEGLATVHDSLLPAVARLAVGPSRHSSSGSMGGARQRLYRHGVHIEVACERAVQQLLTHAYLDAGGAASGTSGSSRDGGRGGATRPGLGSGGGSGPIQRGEALLNAVMVLGHREDESSGRGGGGGGCAALGALPLSQALVQRHGFGGAVESALLCHAVALDEAQSAYLAALLGVSSLAEAPVLVPAGAAAHAGGAGAPAVPGVGGVDTAVLMSQISQIKDLLPDFGDGYLAVCLDAYDGQPEQVIDALLGGSLYPQLSDVDPRMTLQQYQQRYDGGTAGGTGTAGPGDKGKRPVEPLLQPQQEQQYGHSSSSSSSTAVAGGSSWGAGGGASSAAATSAGGNSSAPAKPRPTESLTAKYLDVREGTYRDSLIHQATALQWEYDDEYDDSMDDLINLKTDGITELEEAAAAGPPGTDRQGGSSGAGPGAAAAQRALQGLSLGPQGQGRLQAPAQQPPGGRGGGRRGAGGKLWVLDGRIYNYPKPGAKEVGSREDAERQLEAAQQATQEIHGLGPGGNRPLAAVRPSQQWRQQQQEQAEEAAARGGNLQQQPRGPPAGGGRGAPPGAPGAGGMGGGGRNGSGGGGGRGGGGRGQGGSERDQRFKDQHKAAIGNHHRKDRALKKAMGGYSG